MEDQQPITNQECEEPNVSNTEQPVSNVEYASADETAGPDTERDENKV